MILTESGKEQTKSGAEIEALVDPGVWNTKVPDLVKDIQLAIINTWTKMGDHRSD